MQQVYISGAFDSTRGDTLRFFQEAARLGKVTLFLKGDKDIIKESGKKPKFSLDERTYFTESVRYIERVVVPESWSDDTLPVSEIHSSGESPVGGLWFVKDNEDTRGKRDFAKTNGLEYRLCKASDLQGYPDYPDLADLGRNEQKTGRKVLVTGCYDLFHTGHIRFFEEVSDYGDLYVVIGSDKNVGLLKGDSHPLFKEDERLFIIDSMKYVKQSLISTGSGWMDAEPEIAIVKPDIYAVNEDGDKPEKREFCEQHDLQYLILKRKPREGLPARSSTELRGF
ncbi:MAG: adenylyltransferase/cytidyltransferase family protein [Spirochaetales bacterium]|nr:adenylyltransferase/cytidyltransferase family protein [Spirochaetales bacterium]